MVSWGMLNSRKFAVKFISIILTQTFLLSNIAFAVPSAPQDKSVVQQEITTDPDSIVIPRDFGLVKSRFKGKDDRLIVHIQDAHCNYEAQANIVKVLESLIKNYNVNMVSVEGADGVIDTSWFKAFPDEEVRKEVADYFMKKGEITGPEFLSITTDLPVKLFGAETRSYYIENLNAFTSSYPLKEETEKYYNGIKSVLNRLKGYIYSEELKTLDARMQDYESKKIQFNDYVRFLQALAERHKINIREYDNFFKLVNVLIYEKKIDFNVTDKERGALIDELSKRISKNALTDLVDQSLSFKVGRVSSAEYYNYLKSLAVKNGIDLAKSHPNLYNYIIYNAVYSKIENEKLFNDIKKVELAIKEKLFKNDDQRILDKLSRHIEILLGLVNIKLLNGDFDYYKSRKEEFAPAAFLEFIKSKSVQYGLAYDIDAMAEPVINSVQKLEDFYAIAIKRDKALVDNTVQEMKKDNARIAVLITGGFHSEGIAKLLEKQGISYLVVCPSITKDVPSPYIQILTNQRTPLENILVGVPEVKQAKQGKQALLAPYIISAARQLKPRELKELNRLIGEINDQGLVNRVENFEKDWADSYVNVWVRGTERFAGRKSLPKDKETLLEAYKIAVHDAVLKGKISKEYEKTAYALAEAAFDKIYEAREREFATTTKKAEQASGGVKRASTSGVPETIDGFIESADQDEPVYITDIKRNFDILADKDSEAIVYVFNLGENGERKISIKIPKLADLTTPERLNFVKRYVCATIYNGLVTLGGYSLTIYVNTSDNDLNAFIEGIIKTIKNSDRSAPERYSQALNILDRLIRAETGSAANSFNIAKQDISSMPFSLESSSLAEGRAVSLDAVKNIPTERVLVGIDVGGSDIKIMLSKGAEIGFIKVYNWKPANFTKAEEHLEPVSLLVRMARAYISLNALKPDDKENVAKRLENVVSDDKATAEQIESVVSEIEQKLPKEGLVKIEAIGISWPDVVINNSIVGGETSKTKGLRDTFKGGYEKEFAKITKMNEVISEEFNCPVGIINDGVMAAYTVAVEDKEGRNNIEATAGGTSIGSGILAKGRLAQYVYAISNLIYDLGSLKSAQAESPSVTAIRNNNTGISGTLQKGPTQEGAFRLAVKYKLSDSLKSKGLLTEEKGKLIVAAGKEKELLSYLIKLAADENNDNAKNIFVDIGKSLGIAAVLSKVYIPDMPDKKFFFGRVFENPRIFEFITQGIKSVLGNDFNPENFTAAKDDVANSPLMKSLVEKKGNDAVKSLGQTVGALHLAHQTLLEYNMKRASASGAKKAPGTPDLTLAEVKFYDELCDRYNEPFDGIDKLSGIFDLIKSRGPPFARRIEGFIKDRIFRIRIVDLEKAKGEGKQITDERFFPRTDARLMGVAGHYRQYFTEVEKEGKKEIKYIATLFIPKAMLEECIKNKHLGAALLIHETSETFIPEYEGLSRHAYANILENLVSSGDAQKVGLSEFAKYYLDTAQAEAQNGNLACLDYLYYLLSTYASRKDPAGDFLQYLHTKIHNINGPTSIRRIETAEEMSCWYRNQLEYENAPQRIEKLNYPIDKIRELSDRVSSLINQHLVDEKVVKQALFSVDLKKDFPYFKQGAENEDYCVRRECDYPHDMPINIWLPRASISPDQNLYVKYKIPYRNDSEEKQKREAKEAVEEALSKMERDTTRDHLQDPMSSVDEFVRENKIGPYLTLEEKSGLASLEYKDGKTKETKTVEFQTKEFFMKERLKTLLGTKADAWVEEKIALLVSDILVEQMEIIQSQNPAGKTLIGIAGPGGAGKTTIVRLIESAVKASKRTFTQHGTDSDDYLHPQDIRYKASKPQRVPQIEGGGMYDVELLRQHVLTLKAGGEFKTRGDPKSGVAPKTITASDINVIEGVYVAHESMVRSILDIYAVLAEESPTSDFDRLRRKMIRDASRWTGRGGFTLPFGILDFARKQYWEQRDMISEDAKEADIIWCADTNTIYLRKDSRALPLMKDHYAIHANNLTRGKAEYNRLSDSDPERYDRVIDAIRVLVDGYDSIKTISKKVRRQALRDIMPPNQESTKIMAEVRNRISPKEQKTLDSIQNDIRGDIAEEVSDIRSSASGLEREINRMTAAFDELIRSGSEESVVSTLDELISAWEFHNNIRNPETANRIKETIKSVIKASAQVYPIFSKGWLKQAMERLPQAKQGALQTMIEELVKDVRRDKIVVRLLPVGPRGTRYFQSTMGQYGVPKPLTETIRVNPATGQRKSFLDTATERALCGNNPAQNVFVITDQSIVGRVQESIAEYNVPAVNVFAEPRGANTAAVMGMAAVLIGEQYGYETVISAMTTDHDILELNELGQAFDHIETQVALEPVIGILGITPARVDTSMGHVIRSTNPVLGNSYSYNVQKFEEKPSPSRAEELTREGAVWNSGKFMFSAGAVLNAFKEFQPDYYAGLMRIKEAITKAMLQNPTMGVVELTALPEVKRVIEAEYANFAIAPWGNQPFEKAIVEKAASQSMRFAVDVATFSKPWTDLGNSFQRYLSEETDTNGNVRRVPNPANVTLVETRESNIEINSRDTETRVYVYGMENCLVAYDHVSNKVVVVAPREHDIVLKKLYEAQADSPTLKKYIELNAPNPKGEAQATPTQPTVDNKGNITILGNEGDVLVLESEKASLSSKEQEFAPFLNNENVAVYSEGGLTAVAGLRGVTVIRQGRDIYVYGPKYQGLASVELGKLVKDAAKTKAKLETVKTAIENQALTPKAASAYINEGHEEFWNNFRQTGAFISYDVEMLVQLASYPNRSIAIEATKSFMELARKIKDLHTERSAEANNRMGIVAIQMIRATNSVLNEALNNLGFTSEEKLVERLNAIRNPAKFDSTRKDKIKKIFILTRSKPGGEIAVNSIIMQAMQNLFPGVPIVLIGPKKNNQLFSGMNISFVEPRKITTETLSEIIVGNWTQLREVVEAETQELSNPAEQCLVIDTFSRPVFFSTLPIFRNDASSGSYLYFSMVPYKRDELVMTYGETVKQWLESIFGTQKQEFYAKVAMPAEYIIEAETVYNCFGLTTKHVVAVSNGCGEDYSKAMRVEFEIKLIKTLAEKKIPVIFDMGFTEQELERAGQIEEAIRQAGFSTAVVEQATIQNIPQGSKAQVIFYKGPIAGFGALIGRSQQYIGYDSAFQHIASGLRTPLTTIFSGYQSEEFPLMWSPYCANYKNIISVKTNQKTARSNEIFESTISSVEAYRNIGTLEGALKNIFPIANEVAAGNISMEEAVRRAQQYMTPEIKNLAPTFVAIVKQRDNKAVYGVSEEVLVAALKIIVSKPTTTRLSASGLAKELAESGRPIIYRPVRGLTPQQAKEQAGYVFQTYPWGGYGIAELLGLQGTEEERKIAETWFNSVQEDGLSIVLEGLTLKEVIDANPEAMLGRGIDAKRIFSKFLGKDETQPQVVHLGFNKKIVGNKETFVNLCVKERELMEELKKVLGTHIKNDIEWKGYANAYGKWVEKQGRKRWTVKGLLPTVGYITPEFGNRIFERIRETRQEIVSYLNEIPLKAGQVILAPVGYIHSIVGSHQGHPLTGLNAKNEAWYIFSIGKDENGNDRLLYFEPQQTSNTTFSPFDFPTPMEWKEGKIAMRKSIANGKLNKDITELGRGEPAGDIEAIRIIAEEAFLYEPSKESDFVIQNEQTEPRDVTGEGAYSAAMLSKAEALIEGTYPVWPEELFNLHRIKLEGKGVSKPASITVEPQKTFYELTVIKGSMEVIIRGKKEKLTPGSSVFVPASNKEPIVISSTGEAEVLLLYPPQSAKPGVEKAVPTRSSASDLAEELAESGRPITFAAPNIRIGKHAFTWGELAKYSKILKFLGLSPAEIGVEDNEPVAEGWIVSDDGKYPSQIDLGNGEAMSLREFLAAHAVEVLGREHVDAYGPYLGCVMKLLDARDTLSIAVHPVEGHKELPAKPEYWKMLGEGATVYFGFNKNVTSEQVKEAVPQPNPEVKAILGKLKENGEKLQKLVIDNLQRLEEPEAQAELANEGLTSQELKLLIAFLNQNGTLEDLLNIETYEQGELVDVPGAVIHAIRGRAKDAVTPATNESRSSFVAEWSQAPAKVEAEKGLDLGKAAVSIYDRDKLISKRARPNKENPEATVAVMQDAVDREILPGAFKKLNPGDYKLQPVSIYRDNYGNEAFRLFESPVVVVEEMRISRGADKGLVVKDIRGKERQGLGYPVFIEKGSVEIRNEKGEKVLELRKGQGAIIPAVISQSITIVSPAGKSIIQRWFAPLAEEREAIKADKEKTRVAAKTTEYEPLMPAAEVRTSASGMASKLTAEEIYAVSTGPDRDVLQGLLSQFALSGTLDERVIVVAHDTDLTPVPTGQVMQAGERSINRYLNGRMIDIRAKGSELENAITGVLSELKAKGIDYRLVTIAGEAAVGQIGEAKLKKLGHVLNISNKDKNGEDRFIPLIGLYELAFRIAYESGPENILACLNRIGLNPNNTPFTRDDVDALLNNRIISILPRIVPINTAEAVEAYNAAQKALISL